MKHAVKFILLFVLLLTFPSIGAAGSPPKTVALWDFENNSQEGLADITRVDFLRRALPEMLVANLLQVPDVKLVERVHIREILEEQKLGSSDLTDAKSKVNLGKITGAYYMVFGNYMAIGDVVRMVVRVVEVETTRVLFVDDISGELSTLPALVGELSQRVAKNFGSARFESLSSGTAMDIEVWRLYDDGIQRIDQRDYANAEKIFAAIIKKYPDFAPAQRQLAMARSGADYRQGLSLIEKKDFDGAIALFKRLLKENAAFDPAREKLKEALRLKRQAG